ncbi:hypothetical protein FO519_006538 [Halicephalobus sp. NKZ332]|nr:hypothetical protein FO519_006538 [Halicephalobus sp. NKZ332]
MRQKLEKEAAAAEEYDDEEWEDEEWEDEEEDVVDTTFTFKPPEPKKEEKKEEPKKDEKKEVKKEEPKKDEVKKDSKKEESKKEDTKKDSKKEDSKKEDAKKDSKKEDSKKENGSISGKKDEKTSKKSDSSSKIKLVEEEPGAEEGELDTEFVMDLGKKKAPQEPEGPKIPAVDYYSFSETIKAPSTKDKKKDSEEKSSKEKDTKKDKKEDKEKTSKDKGKDEKAKKEDKEKTSSKDKVNGKDASKKTSSEDKGKDKEKVKKDEKEKPSTKDEKTKKPEDKASTSKEKDEKSRPTSVASKKTEDTLKDKDKDKPRSTSVVAKKTEDTVKDKDKPRSTSAVPKKEPPPVPKKPTIKLTMPSESESEELDSETVTADVKKPEDKDKKPPGSSALAKKPVEEEELDEPEIEEDELDTDFILDLNKPKPKHDIKLVDKPKDEAKKPSSKDKEPSKDKDKVSSKDKEPSKDKEKPSSKDKDKVPTKDKEPSKDKDKVSSKDKEPSKDKAPTKDKEPSKDKEKPSSKDKDKVPTKDKEPSKDKEKVSSKDKEPSKDKEKVSSKDKEPSKDKDKVPTKDKEKDKEEKPRSKSVAKKPEEEKKPKDDKKKPKEKVPEDKAKAAKKPKADKEEDGEEVPKKAKKKPVSGEGDVDPDAEFTIKPKKKKKDPEEADDEEDSESKKKKKPTTKAKEKPKNKKDEGDERIKKPKKIKEKKPKEKKVWVPPPKPKWIPPPRPPVEVIPQFVKEKTICEILKEEKVDPKKRYARKVEHVDTNIPFVIPWEQSAALQSQAGMKSFGGKRDPNDKIEVKIKEGKLKSESTLPLWEDGAKTNATQKGQNPFGGHRKNVGNVVDNHEFKSDSKLALCEGVIPLANRGCINDQSKMTPFSSLRLQKMNLPQASKEGNSFISRQFAPCKEIAGTNVIDRRRGIVQFVDGSEPKVDRASEGFVPLLFNSNFIEKRSGAAFGDFRPLIHQSEGGYKMTLEDEIACKMVVPFQDLRDKIEVQLMLGLGNKKELIYYKAVINNLKTDFNIDIWEICHLHGFPEPYALFVELDFELDSSRNFIVKEDNVVLNPSCEKNFNKAPIDYEKRNQKDVDFTIEGGNFGRQTTTRGGPRILEKSTLVTDFSVNKEVHRIYDSTGTKLTLAPCSSDFFDSKRRDFCSFEKRNFSAEFNRSKTDESSRFTSCNADPGSSHTVLSPGRIAPRKSFSASEPTTVPNPKFKSVPLDEEIVKIKVHIE